jgi:hypothetical protein
MAEVRFQAAANYFFLLYSFQTSSGAHPPFYTVGTGGSFPGCEADYSLPSSAEVKNGGAIPPLPYKSSWHGA